MVLLNISYETFYVKSFSENITAYLNDKRFVLYYGAITSGFGNIQSFSCSISQAVAQRPFITLALSLST